MPENYPSIINIALVGGDTYCKDFLEKTLRDYPKREVNARFVAVADTNPQSPGILFAKDRGLITLNDYQDLYKPRYNIHLIIVMHSDQKILENILKTKPLHIRVMSYYIFEIFWKAIRLEEGKLREQNQEIKTILNAIRDFILVIRPDKVIEEVNDAFLEKMHFTREEVIGKKCYEILQRFKHPCNQPDISCPLSEVIRNKRPSHQVLIRPGRDQKPRYIDVSIFPIWEKDGKIAKFIEVSRDITKRNIKPEK